MEITIDLSDDDHIAFLESLESALGWPHSKRKELAQLAVGAWLSWLSGEKRYNSLTEQYVDWFEQIYEHLLPETEAPSTERLFNSFNVPYGQAQYIARVLNNRDTARWRDYAREELKAQLRGQKEEIDKCIAKGDELAPIEIVLSKTAARVLRTITNDLLRESRREEDMPHVSGSGDFVAVTMTAGTCKKVCKELNFKEE
jgi:hypothetical protein